MYLVLTTKLADSEERAASDADDSTENLKDRRVHDFVEQGKTFAMLQIRFDGSAIVVFGAGLGDVVRENTWSRLTPASLFHGTMRGPRMLAREWSY